jgi:hypothetical protein
MLQMDPLFPKRSFSDVAGPDLEDAVAGQKDGNAACRAGTGGGGAATVSTGFPVFLVFVMAVALILSKPWKGLEE